MNSADERIARFLSILRDSVGTKLAADEGAIMIVVANNGIPMCSHTPNLKPEVVIELLEGVTQYYKDELNDA